MPPPRSKSRETSNTNQERQVGAIFTHQQRFTDVIFRSSPKTLKSKVHGDRAVYFEAGDEGKVTVEPSATAGARLSKEGKAGPGAGESDRSHSQSRSSSSDKVKHRGAGGSGSSGGGGGGGGHFRRIGVVSLPPHTAEIQETDSSKMKAEVARRISLDDLSAAFQGKQLQLLTRAEQSSVLVSDFPEFC